MQDVCQLAGVMDEKADMFQLEDRYDQLGTGKPAKTVPFSGWTPASSPQERSQPGSRVTGGRACPGRSDLIPQEFSPLSQFMACTW